RREPQWHREETDRKNREHPHDARRPAGPASTWLPLKDLMPEIRRLDAFEIGEASRLATHRTPPVVLEACSVPYGDVRRRWLPSNPSTRRSLSSSSPRSSGGRSPLAAEC